MTTIAWRPGILAADTLITTNYRRSEATKIAERAGVLAGACGSLEYMRVFLDWFRGGMRGDICDRIGPIEETEDHPNAYGWVFFMDVIVQFTPLGMTEVRAPVYAAGSGAAFAYGALDNGLSPREAVLTAMRRDADTGGRITVLRGRE